MAFLLLGLIVGIATSTLQHDYSFKEMSGYILVAIGGALYGKFISLFIAEMFFVENAMLQSALLLGGALGFVGIKVLIRSVQKKSESMPPLLKTS
jgi:positive regulator of sigma E activity